MKNGNLVASIDTTGFILERPVVHRKRINGKRPSKQHARLSSPTLMISPLGPGPARQHINSHFKNTEAFQQRPWGSVGGKQQVYGTIKLLFVILN